MVRLKWDNEDSPMYQAGVSQGVFYGEDGVGHAWSGLISVTEKPQANAPTAVYNAMGQKYDIFGNVAEKKHGLACYIYPEVMDEYLGYEYREEFGFVVDERPPKKFHMAYRVELGDGLYEIHVLLNQIATFGETPRQTITSNIAPSTITMNLEGAVDPRFGASHIVLDSRAPFTKSAEVILFGDQYNDANINSFLAAEPVWETVAANYAPIIEPDYDNMVWFGGENLITSIRDVLGPVDYPSSYVGLKRDDSQAYYIASLYHGSHMFGVGETITITLKGYVPSGRSGFRLYAQLPDDSVLNMGGMMTYVGDGVYEQTYTFTEAIKNPVYIRVYSALNNQEAADNSGDIYLEWAKIEFGSTSTPWTPAPSDSDQKPRPTDQYPANCKPGVMHSSKWISVNGNTQVFYDEDRKGLALHSHTSFESLNNYNDIYWDDRTPHVSINTIPGYILEGRSVHAKARVTMIDPISDLMSSRYATIGVGQNGPTADSPPNTRGESDLYVLNDNLKVPVGSEYDSIRLYHGGSSDTETVTFTDILVASPGQEPTFFDVNSKPPTKGVRYQRVSTPNGDYTIKQELRLRSR